MTMVAGDPPSPLAVARVAPWLDRFIERYTWAVGAATVAGALVLLVVNGLDARWSTAIMVAAVALLGIPHDAYDLSLGRTCLAPKLGPWWSPVFVGAYVTLAIAALLFWLMAPWLALACLLVGGALHWGADDLEHDGVEASHAWMAFSRGSIPVALPLLFFPDRSAEVFMALTGSSSSNGTLIMVIGGIATVLAIPGLIYQVWRWRHVPRIGLRVLFELGALFFWFSVAEPIIAFTLYFCAWHAVRHSFRSMALMPAATGRQAGRAYAVAVLVPTAATWMFGVVAWMVLSAQSEPTNSSALWRIVFIGFFALTIPHVALERVQSLTRIRRRGHGSRTRMPRSDR